MKFEAFLNLPPRSLKDYFALIHDPISLKALQKLVRGIHGRQPATGVSDFKGWAAFEEKASLLWKNAHFYNEEGSSIYNLATELKVRFMVIAANLQKQACIVTSCRTFSKINWDKPRLQFPSLHSRRRSN